MRKTRSDPNFCPSRALTIVNAATASECATIAVPAVVGAVSTSATMPPIEIGSALMLSEICACLSAMMAMGAHDGCDCAASLSPTVASSVIAFSPEQAWDLLWLGAWRQGTRALRPKVSRVCQARERQFGRV